MNGEHLYDLRQPHTGARRDTNGAGDEFQATISSAWAIGLVLAAYDHELFQAPHEMGKGARRREAEAWAATLRELKGAQWRITSSLIPLRLRSCRVVETPRAFQPVG